MAKRKLTKQQLHRIQQIQSEKVERANKRSLKAEAAIEHGELGEETEGLVIAHYGVTLDVENNDKARFRCYKRAQIPALVTGDKVIWRPGKDGSGVIVALAERKSILSRPDSRGTLRPVAANIDQIFVVVSPAPETPVNLIDRYLVAAHSSNIEPIIVFNKSDLMPEGHKMRALQVEYQQLGYKTILVSALDVDEFGPLTALLETRTSIFVGQSGVGKSSLINALLPEVQSRTAEISVATGKGKHTTTTAVLYHMTCGGQLIDSPGIREFGLWHISPDELHFGYPEIANLNPCKFRDCKHVIEPGCELKAAVDSNRILERRYRSFIAIRDSLDEVEMRG